MKCKASVRKLSLLGIITVEKERQLEYEIDKAKAANRELHKPKKYIIEDTLKGMERIKRDRFSFLY